MEIKPKTPLVSVVMAAYNGASYIAEQLESIANQDYSNFEAIIVDDCSTDNTVGIVNGFVARDPRFSLRRSVKNSGVIAAFERGLTLAAGEYIALADQDDIWDRDKISTLKEALETNPEADIAFSDLRLVDEEGNLIAASMWKYQKIYPKSGKPFRKLLYANFITGCACMLRKRLLEKALPFPSGCISHDWWLAAVAASEGCGGVVLVDRPLVSYRQHGRNVIGAHSGRLSAAIQRAPDIEKRIRWYDRNLKRIEGYIERGGDWTAGDLRCMTALKTMYSGYIDDKGSSIVKRLRKLPLRLSFAVIQDRTHVLGVVLFTLFPRIVETLQNFFPSAGIGSKRKA